MKTPPDTDGQMFRILVESVKDYGIFMLDPDGYILSWNVGAERLKGYSAHEIIGKHFEIFYTEDAQLRKHPQYELEVAKEKGRYEEEGWRIKKDRTRFWANVVITAVYDDEGKLSGFSKVTRDVTQRRKDELQLKSAKEELEQRVDQRTRELSQLNDTLRGEIEEKNRTAAELRDAVRVRDEFLSIASHELRTPITPLKLLLQTLVLHLRSGTLEKMPKGRVEKMAETLDRSLNRLVKLVDSLLDVARINAGKIELHSENFDVVEVLQETCSRFEQEALNRGSLIQVVCPESLNVNLDRVRFEQILSNLLTNAIKFGDGKPILVSIEASNARLRLKVKDQGIGINREDTLRIFDRFEQVAEQSHSSGGLGLGLYITKQIVDAQGGSVFVESELSTGSNFIVELPLK